MWIEFNTNPFGLRVGDCVIRAISKALNRPWEDIYIDLCLQGFLMGDLPSSNAVWSAYLKHKGFKRRTVECFSDCYSIDDFCKDNPIGVYVIGTGSHAVCVENGNIYDAWDSRQESPVYYFEKEN
ncbi:MAG: hypothetical protein U0M02_06910 [Acutalibacteraceae bacterium]|nr:hypothetical protein [Acutalibacteraceae bacterium]